MQRSPSSPRRIRIFLSSPGDVVEERKLALELIDNTLRKDPAFRDRFLIEAVAWDDPEAPTPMLATEVPQASVNKEKPPPSQCDIVVVIVWSRLGSPFELGGRQWASGTEWEYEDAANAPSKPTILVYQRTTIPSLADLKLDDPEASAKLTQRQVQYRALQTFLGRVQGCTGYADPQDLRRRLEQDLRRILNRFVERPFETGPSTPFPGEIGRGPSHSEPAAIPPLPGPLSTPLPSLPEHYQPREKDLAAVKATLLEDGSSVGIVGRARATGLRGMGGIGKTTLAAALVQDPDIRARFDYGTVWLTFGRRAVGPEQVVLDQLNALGRMITGRAVGYTTQQEARADLARLLGERRLLVVLDDVWEPRLVDCQATCKTGPSAFPVQAEGMRA